MTRVEYMKELELLLSDIPAEEREDAINYYNDYFDAVGEENEESTIEALGTPEELAKTIVAANQDANADPNRRGRIDPVAARRLPTHMDAKPKKSSGMVILLVILGIFACPILIPLCFALMITIFAIGMAMIAVIIALAAAIVACGIGAFFGGIFALIGAAMNFIANPFGSLVIMGFALLAIAFGLLFFIGCGFIIGKIVPPVFRVAVSIIKMPVDWIKAKWAARRDR